MDDQREVSRLLRSALATLEHNLEIVEMPSGEEAILDASLNKVDLLVADFRLPGLSGIQLMNKIKEFYPPVKVILITGISDPYVRKEVAQAGADAFFIKPISRADFLDAVERVLGLVETILPLEPILKEDETDSRQGLADLLSGLRTNVKAQSVMLLNDRGRVLACAGEMPEKNKEISLVASLMAIYSAGQKVSLLIGHEFNSSWHVFDGNSFDLIFAPVNTTHAMLLVGEKIAKEDVVLENIRSFGRFRQDIESALSALDGPAIPYIKEASQESPINPVIDLPGENLDMFFKQSKLDIKTDELNAFWSEAADGQPVAPLHADGLSYDQARQLGLTPEEDKD